MSAGLIDLARQCCDADDYLDMGYVCAKSGYCYNPLRPIGDTLWFSIPYIFNTSENIFFYLHIFLLALVGLSVYHLLKNILPTCLFVLALLFLTWPTFFHTLSDTPATLFFIEGIVLALIGLQRIDLDCNSAPVFFAAGISLGLSILLRAAYYYPLLISASLFILYWLWQKQRQWPLIFILGFFIPLSFQFISTWKHTGQWSFVSEGRSRSMMNLHLNSDASGYDTYLPQASAFWSPDCMAQAGLLPSLKSADITSATCILKNRFSFYLGSYAASTFLGIDARNFFDNDRSVKMIDATKNLSGYFFELKSLLPLPPGSYHYSVVLQSGKYDAPQAASIQIDKITIAHVSMTSPASPLRKSILNKPITISETAQQYTINIENDSTGYIVAQIRSSAAFNAQAAALEPAASARGFVQPPQLANTMGQSSALTKNNRIFSKVYFVINCLLIIFAIFYLYKLLAKTRSPIIIFIAALLFSVLIQSLMVIPEQRYIQGFLGACCLLCLLPLSSRRPFS